MSHFGKTHYLIYAIMSGIAVCVCVYGGVGNPDSQLNIVQGLKRKFNQIMPKNALFLEKIAKLALHR